MGAFQNQAGCCDCGGDVVRTIHVTGCAGFAASDVGVVIRDSSDNEIDSGTTDGNGDVDFTLPTGTGYKAVVGGGADNYAEATVTFDVGSTPATVSVALVAAVGFGCTTHVNCHRPIPAILAMNTTRSDFTNPVTMTYDSPFDPDPDPKFHDWSFKNKFNNIFSMRDDISGILTWSGGSFSTAATLSSLQCTPFLAVFTGFGSTFTVSE